MKPIMQKRPDLKAPRTPGSIGGKKPEDGKKEKRERKNKEPKKPDTVDIAWRLYAPPPKAVEQEPEEFSEGEGEGEGEEKKSEAGEDQEQINTKVDN